MLCIYLVLNANICHTVFCIEKHLILSLRTSTSILLTEVHVLSPVLYLKHSLVDLLIYLSLKDIGSETVWYEV